MRPTLDPAGHRVPRTKPTCLLHTWRPHGRRPFALVLHLHQQQSSRNLHLQYLAKNQSTQRCQSLITQGSDHPSVLEPHMVLKPLAQRNRPESLTIKRNRINRLSRTRTRATQKTTKSGPIQGGFGGKVTSRRGMKSSYVTPNKIPKKSSSKLRHENHNKELRKTTQRRTGKATHNLEEPRRIIYTYHEGSCKV
jgi:hypothetical protein